MPRVDCWCPARPGPISSVERNLSATRCYNEKQRLYLPLTIGTAHMRTGLHTEGEAEGEGALFTLFTRRARLTLTVLTHDPEELPGSR